MGEIFGNLIAGVGMFLVSLRMIIEGLRPMTGRRLRLLFSRWTHTGLRSGLVGVFSGFISQSMSAVSFVLASLIATGVASVRRALPVIFWANAGAGLLVLIAVIDLKVFVLFIIGIGGLALALERPAQYKPLALTLFGIGLLFYGLFMIRAGAAPLAQTRWFEGALLEAHGSYVLVFCVSALLTFAVQSSPAVSLLGIAFAQEGLFTSGQTIMIIYGANFGSGAITWILAAGLKGRPKQLVMAQVLFNCIICAFFVPLFYLEMYGEIPLVEAFVQATGAALNYQMAYVYLLFNWGGALMLSPFIEPIARLLERFWSPTQEEGWSEMRFLHDQALRDPETALILLDREQSRLFGQLPLYIHELRKMISGNGKPAYESIHGAFQTVAREIDTFTAELFRQELTSAASKRALNVQNRQKLIEGLEEVIRELVLNLNQWALSQVDAALRDAFVEGLDTLLITACEAAESNQSADVELLIKITQDRSELLRAMRQNYIAEESRLAPAGRQLFLRITGLFETAVWLLSRMAQLQRQHLFNQ